MNDLSVDTIIDALGFIDPDQDRKSWARIGMAIKSELGESGFSVFDEWSKGGSKYNKADSKATWRSIRASKGKDVTIATLIYEAQQSGFAFNDNDRIKITAEEIDARKAKREAEEKKAAAEFKRIQGEVARIANLAWEASLPAFEHPYTTRKGVKIFGAKWGQFPVYKEPEAGQPVTPFKHIPALLVPIYGDKGKIVSLQAYFDNDVEPYGDRAYLKLGQKQGGYFVIGKPSDRIVIVEGYATGASVHMATGWCVYVAFDAGNLVDVAKTARQWFPHAEIIIAGDHDRPNPKNGKRAGNDAAKEAGIAVNGRVIIPTSEGDDWNDVHQRDGLEAVQSALMAHTLPKPANDNKPVEFDSYTPFTDITAQGKPKATIDNVKELLRRMGAIVRYNVIKKDVEILIPGHSASRDNRLVSCITHIISKCNLVGIPTGGIEGFLTTIADENQFNPVLTWVNSQPWDGVNRWDEFCKTVTPKEEKILPNGTALHVALIKRWMLSAIAAANRDGTALQGMLVLQGDQGLGKTSWLKSLVPSSLDIVRDGLILKLDDKDSIKRVISFWLVELGEIDATFRKSDQSALKAFLTKDSDGIRLPYARGESEFGRRTAFFGSVNPKSFLHDETGSRRYWTIECEHVDYEHTFDMQQVWAEIQAAYDAGMHWHLSPEEADALNESNSEHMAVDPIEERILSRLDWSTPVMEWRWIQATELLIEIGIDRPTRSDSTNAGSVVRKHNEGKSKRSNGKTLLLVPPKIAPFGSDYDRPF